MLKGITPSDLNMYHSTENPTRPCTFDRRKSPNGRVVSDTLTEKAWEEATQVQWTTEAEQGLRMCRDGRGLESNLVSFSKGFSKRPHILAIIKVDSEYLRFSFKLKVDYFILYWILVSTLVIFLLLFSMNKRRRTNESSLQ